MLRQVKRETFPMRMRITDSNWHKGIMIGNTIIFNAIRRKETKQIKNIYKHNNDTHAFYVEYKKENGLYLIYRD